VRRVLLPLAERASDAALFARSMLRRDAAFTSAPAVVPAPASVLVIAPHADDEAIGCGGTIALAGSATIVFLTGTGERRAEAESAARTLGAGELVFLELAEGSLGAARPERLRAIIDRVDPERVLAPFPLDRHLDHVDAARLVASALDGETAPVWCYEVWSPLDPNRLVDISAVVETKLEAIGRHVSQTSRHDFGEAALGLNRYRSLLAPGATHAEAFFECSPRDFGRLVGGLR
jgi:N-acetylglucosamine malate deacetylase 1